MKILVTGGAGFIGSHVVDASLERGWSVRVADDLSTGLRENVDPRAELVVGDLRDPGVIANALDGGIDVICHHAAQMDVRRSVADPAFDADVNVVGALRLLQAAVDRGVRRVVFASSGGAIYGEPEFTPQSEEHPERPLSPYGCSKLAFDNYLRYYGAIYGVKAASLRYGNVYGPRQRKDGEAGVVAIFGGKILAGEPVTINGTGEQTRDYIFVGDVVRANIAAIDRELDGIFNVGTGIETSVNELFEAICEAADRHVEARHGPAKKGEQLRSVLDASKLRAAGGLPAPLPLSEGLKRTMEWLEKKGAE